jgi:hypothetical protein
LKEDICHILLQGTVLEEQQDGTDGHTGKQADVIDRYILPYFQSVHNNIKESHCSQ